ncbi:prephenate dehydrogenase [Planctomycetota bacterium]|nr:prephenate dehydrogenase [Planctomycetota bacterium]
MASGDILICGLGLMGGSLAAALTRAGRSVLLWHRRPEVAQEAERRGFGKMIATLSEARTAESAVVCTPVSTIPSLVRDIAAVTRAVITDVGSTKCGLLSELHDLDAAGRFIGSHPMCGSHATGLDHADADLYRGRVVITTPTENTDRKALDQIEDMWRVVGARLVRLDPAVHDRAVAVASHLPHLLSSAAAAGLSDAAAPLAAGGFRDTTRVAAGDPALWADILLANRGEVVPELARTLARLEALRDALADADRAAVQRWLEAGQAGRRRFEAAQHR